VDGHNFETRSNHSSYSFNCKYIANTFSVITTIITTTTTTTTTTTATTTTTNNNNNDIK
jgi:hypothetical protein